MNEQINYLKKYLPKDKFDEGMYRLKKGEPVQYIVGNVDFYGLKFNVDKRVLIPRFETEQLVSHLIKYINEKFNTFPVSILDIGTGSGNIAITLKSMVDSIVTGVDISRDALDVAFDNSNINNVDITFLQSDIYSNVTGKFDVIVSNPPYIGDNEDVMDVVYNNEPHTALFGGIDGLDYYCKILKGAKKYLKDNYIIAFEIGSKQASDISVLAKKYLNNSTIKVLKDYSGFDRFIFIFGKVV